MSRNPADYAIWMRFPENRAILRRGVAPDGRSLLVLILRDKARLEAFSALAGQAGFRQLKPGLFRAPTKGMTPDALSVREIAGIFAPEGAEIFPILKSDLRGPSWTIPLLPGATAEQGAAPAADTPDPASVSPIGLNIRGEEVVRDARGRYYRKVSREEGRADFIPETRDAQHTLFLRALRPADLEAIAGALTMMAGRGTLHEADFDRVIDAALEEGPQGRLDMPRQDAVRRVGLAMARKISEDLARMDATPDAIQSAQRVASAATHVLARLFATEAGISPSPAFGGFLRRLRTDTPALDVRGNDVLSAMLPRTRATDAAFQVHDLSDVPENGLRDYAIAVLQGRPEDGSTLLLVSGEAAAERIEGLRGEIGRYYALETVAEITSAVATGIQDHPPVTLIAVGARRPEPLEALPQAALRTFPVLATEDLRSLEREILRSRAKIRDFHSGLIEEADERADSRAENQRQRPYLALSRVSEPFTMVPIALEGATTLALDRLRRDFEDSGGIDAAVAYGLGLPLDELGDHLTAEQVDAVAMRMHASIRNRGFLLGDQTGVGKGRTLAAIAASEIRQNRKRVLYFTESGQINVRDVARDLVGVGVRPVDVQASDPRPHETRVGFLSVGSAFETRTEDPVTGEILERSITSLPARERRRILEAGSWPEGVDILITTYSQFNFREGDAKSAFIEAIDGDTLVVMDEAHNALNPRSNIGRNMREIIQRAGRRNIVFGTATFARSSQGLDLYAPLLPATLEPGIFESITRGGEVAMESFTTMLAQDGVFLRRDHDLSNIEFRVALPDPVRVADYQRVMDAFSPVVEMMIDASSLVGRHLNRAQSVAYHQAIAAGMDRAQARAASNELNQYSIGIGAPLSNLARITVNAIKVDQLVEQAIEEIREGRKPLITFHSTNAGLIDELARDEDGKISEARMAEARGLTLKDQIRRIHQSIYRIRLDGEIHDARDLFEDVRDAARLLEERIEQLPLDLPVSPVDAVIERLEANGISVGEISGRLLCYRDGQIQRREGRDRKAVIDAFNGGTLDVLIYNAAGSTGGSFHAAPEYADQRPRTMLEFEPPLDPIKYIQGLGRGNRYGQVARPRVTSVVTGLTPEMRIMQQRNIKLRMLGASVDGNRSHPMLIDDVPDLLNRVGDQATRNVLMTMPAMARRLGFPEYAENLEEMEREDRQAAAAEQTDTGSGDGRAIDSLSNKVLSRALSLSARDQTELVSRIVVEFEAMIEELDSRNANPLKPKQLGGEIEIRDTTLFSGEEREAGNLDLSAFTAPLYLSTGIHHFSERAWTGEDLMSAVEECQRIYGADGLQPWADRIEQAMPMLLRSALPEGMRLEQALADPQGTGARFRQRHARLTDLQWMLENLRPGVAMRFPHAEDPDAELQRVVVGLVPPREAFLFDMPNAYRVRTISPGDSSPTITALSRIMQAGIDRVRFSPGISDGPNERFMRAFDEQALMTRQLPVQILTGNIITAIEEARRHDLGAISLYRDSEGRVHRGIVVRSAKQRLDMLPVSLPRDPLVLEELLRYRLEHTDTFRAQLRIYGSMEESRQPQRSAEEDFIIKVGNRAAEIDFINLRRSNEAFFRSRPGLYEALHGVPIPDPSAIRARMARTMNHRVLRLDMTNPEARERLFTIGRLIGDAPMIASAEARGPLNEIAATIQRIRDAENRAMPRAMGTDAMADPAREPSGEAPARPERLATPAGSWADQVLGAGQQDDETITFGM